MKILIQVVYLIILTQAKYERFVENHIKKEIKLKAFTQAIEELFIKNSIVFNIIFDTSAESSSMNRILAKIQGNASHEIKYFVGGETCYDIDTSAIVFLKDETTLDAFNYFIRLTNEYPKPMKFLIWFEDEFSLNSNIFIENSLSDDFGHISLYEYFIIEENGTLEFVTIEWFHESLCNEPFLSAIAAFDSSTLTWNGDIRNFKKFRNFHNCSLISNIPRYSLRPSVSYELFGTKLRGMYIDLSQVVSRKANFTLFFIGAANFGTEKDHECVQEKFNKNHRFPTNHQFTFYRMANGFGYHVTSTFAQTSFIFIITPDDPIEITEKLFMAFDETTWMWLIITFGITFIVIFVTKFMPKKVQDLIFGKGNTTPGLNVILIFFGIGQMKVPDRSFPRFILMLFILFCLIFRTCYQSKLFEFMTSDMRKPSPLTIHDLYVKNFTIVTVGFSNIIEALNEMIDEKKRPQIKYLNNDREFVKMYLELRKNHSFKLAFFAPSEIISPLQNMCNCNPRVLDQRLFAVQVGIAFLKNHFLYDSTQDVMQNFISAGILQYLYDFYAWMWWRKRIEIEYNEPQVLTMDDLAFGFYIWLGACAVSLIGFVSELIYFILTKIFKKLFEIIFVFLLNYDHFKIYRMQ